MNKNARKLIPAVAMLLVSASMLSTASYAWFSMNNKVTANGMKVDIVAPGSIEISNTIESNEVKFTSGNAQVTINKYDSAVTEGESIANLAAVSSVDGNKFFVAKPTEVKTSGDAFSATVKEYNTTNFADSSAFDEYYGASAMAYADYTFYVRSTATTDKIVKLTTDTGFSRAEGKTAANSIIKSLRFAVLVSEAGTATEVKDKTAAVPSTDSTITGSYAGNVFANQLNGSVGNYTWTLDTYNHEANTATSTNKTDAYAWIKEKIASETPVWSTDSWLVNSTKVLDTVSIYDETKDYLFKLPKANGATYQVRKVILRVWLEGESTSCKVDNLIGVLDETYTLNIGLEASDATVA